MTFQPKTMSLVVYQKIIPYTKFEHFGNIHFRVILQTYSLFCIGCSRYTRQHKHKHIPKAETQKQKTSNTAKAHNNIIDQYLAENKSTKPLESINLFTNFERHFSSMCK